MRLATGRTAFSRPRWNGKTCFMYHSSVVGMLTKRIDCGGSAVENDDLVTILAPELIDIHHGAQFFHAGQDGQLFGFDIADAGGAKDRDDVGGDFAPVAFDFLLDVDLLDGEVGVNGI